LTGGSYNRYGLLVVSRQHSDNERMTIRLKLDSVTNRELQHASVRAHLMEKPQTLDDTVIEVDQFRFRELVDVDLHLSDGVRPRSVMYDAQRYVQRRDAITFADAIMQQAHADAMPLPARPLQLKLGDAFNVLDI